MPVVFPRSLEGCRRQPQTACPRHRHSPRFPDQREAPGWPPGEGLASSFPTGRLAVDAIRELPDGEPAPLPLSLAFLGVGSSMVASVTILSPPHWTFDILEDSSCSVSHRARPAAVGSPVRSTPQWPAMGLAA